MTQRFTTKRRPDIQLAIRYRDEPWRFVAAFVAAVATGLATYPRELQGESAATHFLALLAVYFFIAYVTLLWIRVGTTVLDRRFPWPRFPNSRLAFQLFCCWLLPVLLVYALTRSVLSIPQLAPLTRGNADYREMAAVLVLSLTLACNIAFVCAYFMVLCRRLQRKTQQGLQLVLKAREQLQLKERKITELQQALRGRDSGNGDVDRKTRIFPDNPEDGQYRHVTPMRTELLDYCEISEFEVVEKEVFLHRNDAGKEPVKERSLVAIEDVTGGYFRKIGRNKAIGLHMLKRCVQRDSQFELTLLDDTTVVVSPDYARQIERWILSRISIERE